MVELLYPELRRLAASKMKGERSGHTWQPTVLVNELYLAMVKVKALGGGSGADEQEKAAFLGLAGHLMKRLLIEHSRPLYRRVEKVEFHEGTNLVPTAAESLHTVEAALSRLATIDPKFRSVVEMRVFEGLTGMKSRISSVALPGPSPAIGYSPDVGSRRNSRRPSIHDRPALAGSLGDLSSGTRSSRG